MPSLTLARSPRSRRLLSVVTAAVLALSLNACSRPTGAAASINGQTIDESFVSTTTGELTTGSSTPPGNGQLQFTNRRVLTNQIRHELLAKVAASQKLTVDKAEVNQVTAQGTEQLVQTLSGQNGPAFTPAQVPQAVRDTLLVLQLAQKDAAAAKKTTDVQVKVDLVSFDNRTDAVAAREKYLADPAAMDAGVQAAGAQSKGGSQEISLFTQPDYAAFGLYSEPVGSIVLIDTDTSVSVARITTRKQVQSDQLAANIQNQQDSASRFALAWLALAPYVQAVPVSVNPRFGTWDPIALQVVPTQSGL